MEYRTRTYISADWDCDLDAVEKLRDWNKSKRWSLSFTDAHDLSSCRNDDTNNCNIKKNCSQNLDCSKAFILIIGNNTNSARAGYCMYCKDYSGCYYKYKTNKSFIEFECDYALRNYLPIIVLYNSTVVNRSKCIESVVDIAKAHVAMCYRSEDGKCYWDYGKVLEAFNKL